MTEMLTDNLPLLAGAPNGIKRLRELIVELAVRGKLVPQDASEEPASELLKRIAEEKAQLVAMGKLKKQKPLEDVGDAEKPFALPVGWEWLRLGQLTEASTGHAFKSSEYRSSGTLVLRVTNINPDGTLDLTDAKYIDPVEADSTYESVRLEKDEILLVMVGGSLGKIGIVDENCLPAVLNQNMWKMFRPKSVSRDYLVYGLRFINATQLKITNSTHGHLAQGEYLSKLFPLAPEQEQHRIVAKVDELMALCDRLEAQQADAESAHARLVQVLLDSLIQTRDAVDFAASWQRLAEHFHSLFITEASIDSLKQVLLQLAVMGKLAPQDARDEPACELLKRIAEEKRRMLDAGQIRKQKPLGDIAEEEAPYDLPVTWAWTQLGSQVIESGAGWSPSCEARPRDGDEWGVLKVSAVSWGIYQPNENKALPSNLEARPDHEVVKGDFLVSRANTAELVARSVIVEETPSRLMLSDKIVRLKLTSLCACRYVNIANSTPLARRYYSQVAGGTSSSMKNVSREQILNLPIALPPLAEQHRIVAIVDHLMLLCDTLKRQINAAKQKQRILLNAVMAQV